MCHVIVYILTSLKVAIKLIVILINTVVYKAFICALQLVLSATSCLDLLKL